VIDPATEEQIGTIGNASAADVDKAVAAAKAAFPSWTATSGSDRAKILRKFSEGLKKRKEFLAKWETMDMGKPIDESLWDLDDVAGCFEYCEFYYLLFLLIFILMICLDADMAEDLDKRQNEALESPMEEFTQHMQYQSVGVIGVITPWNYPLLMATWKIAPALAAGCTVVLKVNIHSFFFLWESC